MPSVHLLQERAGMNDPHWHESRHVDDDVKRYYLFDSIKVKRNIR